MVFHRTEDIVVTLIDAALVPDLRFSLYSLHVEDQPVVIDHSGTYPLGGRLFFSPSAYGSYLLAWDTRITTT